MLHVARILVPWLPHAYSAAYARFALFPWLTAATINFHSTFFVDISHFRLPAAITKAKTVATTTTDAAYNSSQPKGNYNKSFIQPRIRRIFLLAIS